MYSWGDRLLVFLICFCIQRSVEAAEVLPVGGGTKVELGTAEMEGSQQPWVLTWVEKLWM